MRRKRVSLGKERERDECLLVPNGLSWKFGICPYFHVRKPTSKERKKKREATFVTNFCTGTTYQVGTTGTTGTFAIYTFSLLVEIKKSLALATGRRQKGNFLFYIRSCLHTILPLLNIVADHHCFAGHSFFPAFLSPQIPGARRRR